MLNIDSLRFPRYELPASLEPLRREVRAFLADVLAPYSALVRSNTWDATSSSRRRSRPVRRSASTGSRIVRAGP